MATDALSTAADLLSNSYPVSAVMSKVGLGLVNGERNQVSEGARMGGAGRRAFAETARAGERGNRF